RDIIVSLIDAQEMIIDTPPSLRKDPTENYIAKIGRLKDQVEKSSIQHLNFVSSTSVFEDREDFPVYTEEDEPNGIQANSEQLKGAEKLLLSENFKTSIVRFGGLFGPGRHPVNYLAGRKHIKDPNGPVNLIHLDDCLGLINAIHESGLTGILNGVHPEHPTNTVQYKS